MYFWVLAGEEQIRVELKYLCLVVMSYQNHMKYNIFIMFSPLLQSVLIAPAWAGAGYINFIRNVYADAGMNGHRGVNAGAVGVRSVR